MKSVGDKLRRERLKQGLDLETLARDLRINHKYLEAIEADERDNLPGGFFYRSFVRQYASALGMNTGEIEAELEMAREAEAPVLDAALTKTDFPIKPPDPIVAESNRLYLGSGRIWASVVLLGAVLAGCSAFYQWWQGRKQTEVAATQQESSQQPAPAAERAPAVQTSAVSAHPEAAPAHVELSADTRVVVSFSATEKTWVSIFSDGKRVFSGFLEPSQSKTLGGKDAFRMRVGNAGGVEITWNGKQIGPVGSKGQVRDVVFTPDNYQILSPSGSL